MGAKSAGRSVWLILTQPQNSGQPNSRIVIKPRIASQAITGRSPFNSLGGLDARACLSFANFCSCFLCESRSFFNRKAALMMSTRQCAPWRAYCTCCCNYAILHRHISGAYFCSSCRHRIDGELSSQPVGEMKHPIDAAAIEHIVLRLQREDTHTQKITRWQDQAKR